MENYKDLIDRYNKYQKWIENSRIVLILLLVLKIVGIIILYFFLKQSFGFLISSTISALILLGLIVWINNYPLIPLIIAIAIFFINMVVKYLTVPLIEKPGLIVDILIIGMLVIGLYGALRSAKIRNEIEKVTGLKLD